MYCPITVLLTTCGRYLSTLPLCLMSIINQTILPETIILVDDNKEKKFYEIEIFKNLLNLMKIKHINFEYYQGKSIGQTNAQQMALKHIKTDWFFSTDDDNILEPNVIELLIKNTRENVGGISGLILSRNDLQNNRKIEYESDIYNKIEDIYKYFNIQMCYNQDKNIKKVEHIYSNYLIKRELIDEYPIDFSPEGHRSETVLTHEIHRKGYDLLIDPNIIIWHLDEKIGGNRTYKKSNKNDILFLEKMIKWGVNINIEENDKMVYQKDEKNMKWLIYEKTGQE